MGKPSKERRRAERQLAAIPVMLRRRSADAQLVTADVSRTGVYIVTDSPPPERELLRLSLELPDGRPLDVIGVVARTEGRPDGENAEGADGAPGMGIDFFALDKEDRHRWERYVRQLEEEGALAAGPHTSPRPLPTRRRHPRHFSQFLVRLRDRKRLQELYTRDISSGGMFLGTPRPGKVSERVQVILIHPDSRMKFYLRGRVVRIVDDVPPTQRGVAVAFDVLGEERDEALVDFIDSGIADLDLAFDGDPARLSQLEIAAELEPESADVLARLGLALVEDLQPERAVETLERALAVDETLIDAHRGLYQAYTLLERPERAAMHLARVRALQGGD